MNHVMQIGTIEGKTRIYLEDYAYTYLKKQEKAEKKKYFLYGEWEEKEGEEKLYIYGISDSPKTEHTYFKEYQPLGFFRYKQKEKYWVDVKGKETLIQGFFVFYAPNSAMQEYLVDTNKQKNEADKPEVQNTRKMTRENPPIKETFISVRKPRRYNKKRKYDISNLMMPALVAGMVLLLGAAVSTPNGQKKLQIFQQIVADVMNDTQTEEEFIVEEKRLEETDSVIETMNPQNAANTPTEDSVNDGTVQGVENSSDTSIETANSSVNNSGTSIEEQNSSINTDTFSTMNEELENMESMTNESDTSKTNYEEYIVQEGDTLAAICKNKYGSLTKMEEICGINQIKDADYIAPGQKLYLP